MHGLSRAFRVLHPGSALASTSVMQSETTRHVVSCCAASCRLEAAPVDVDYRLMELAAGGPDRADPAFLATLLSPLALSPDPLDYLLPWMLLQSLQAIDAIPRTASSDEVSPNAGSYPHHFPAQTSMRQQY